MREAFCTALPRHAPPISLSSYHYRCVLVRLHLSSRPTTNPRTHPPTHPTTDPPTNLHTPDTELAALRTGRADPRILDKVRVEAYAATVSLEKVAQVAVFFFKKKSVYVPSYYCLCVTILLFMCPHTTVCVLMLPCMCPHTTVFVSS